jgi:hypothetical protein
VEENTNIDVVEETEGNYVRAFKYTKAHVNVLDEVPQSYSHEGNLELDQTKYIVETRDHEYVDSKMVRLFSRVCAFYEEEGHAIMDCLLCLFTLKQVLLRMWSYRMWHKH